MGSPGSHPPCSRVLPREHDWHLQNSKTLASPSIPPLCFWAEHFRVRNSNVLLGVLRERGQRPIASKSLTRLATPKPSRRSLVRKDETVRHHKCEKESHRGNLRRDWLTISSPKSVGRIVPDELFSNSARQGRISTHQLVNNVLKACLRTGRLGHDASNVIASVSRSVSHLKLVPVAARRF